MNILTKLSKLAHLSPDQIVAKLHNNGWIRGKDMTRDDYDRLNRGEVMLCEWYPDGTLWGPTRYPRISRNWSLETCNDSLGGYFYIAAKDYIGGELPDRPSD